MLTKKIKIFLLGASGQLGKVIKKNLEQNSIFFVNSKKINLESIIDINKKLLAFRPHVIINAAAYTNVDKAEMEKNKCNKINNISCKYISDFCKKFNVYMIHFSTDYVYADGGGKKSELFKKKPLNFYGKSKLNGENQIIKSNINYTILRLSWLYGKGKNSFVTKILNQIKKFKNINIFSNETGCPVSTELVSRLINKLLYLYLAKRTVIGIFNFTTTGSTNRLKMANEILKESTKKNKKFLKIKITSSYLSNKVKRPKNSLLNISKIQKCVNFRIPNWKKDLHNFLRNN